MKYLLLLLTLFPILSKAHGPTPQKADETITIHAPAAKVWGQIADFPNVATWNPGLEKSAGDGGNKAGAKRSLTFKNGGVLNEELDEYSVDGMYYAYRASGEIDMQALPVSSLNAKIQVTAIDDGNSTVTWKARFYRSFTGNEPPPGQDDEAAVQGVTAFFRSGLQMLKQMAETKQ